MIVLQQKSFLILVSALPLPLPVFQHSAARQLHVGDVTTFSRQVVVLKQMSAQNTEYMTVVHVLEQSIFC